MSGLSGEESSLRELRGTKKVVIAGRVQLDALHAIGMDEHVVEVPEINVRKILGDDLLQLGIDDFALLLVEGGAALANELIDAWVGVEGAVGAFGREAGGVEDVLEDVGVLISTDPAHRVHLISALS